MLPAGYVGLFDRLAKTGKEHGYALALHGSLSNDMDIMAMPWTHDAIPLPKLIEKLHDAMTFLRVDVAMDNGFYGGEGYFKDHSRITGPEYKPHNRLAWSIHLGMGARLDISAMQREQDSPIPKFNIDWCVDSEAYLLMCDLVPHDEDDDVDEVFQSENIADCRHVLDHLIKVRCQPYRKKVEDSGIVAIVTRADEPVASYVPKEADKAERLLAMLNRTWTPPVISK